MKYFTYELWEQMNDENEDIRKKASDKWDSNIKLYNKEFERVKTLLTKDFLRKFYNKEEFHDYYVKSINIEDNKSKKPTIKLSLYLGKDSCDIVYSGVDEIKFNYLSIKNTLGFNIGLCEVGYNEFTYIDDKIISHEILLSSGATIHIKSKRVMIVKNI